MNQVPEVLNYQQASGFEDELFPHGATSDKPMLGVIPGEVIEQLQL